MNVRVGYKKYQCIFRSYLDRVLYKWDEREGMMRRRRRRRTEGGRGEGDGKVESLLFSSDCDTKDDG